MAQPETATSTSATVAGATEDLKQLALAKRDNRVQTEVSPEGRGAFRPRSFC